MLQKNVARDWQGTLDIVIIPVIADDLTNTASYVGKLTERRFTVIAAYLRKQAKRHGKDLTYALDVSLASPIVDLPPARPAPGASGLSNVFWSLRFRWWAWRHQPDNHHDSQIRLYVLYQSPETGKTLPHSTGLQNGLLGIIQARAFSEYNNINNVIIVHELLHIVGASDKYQLASGQPNYPNGYAEPLRQPRYPQTRAEIMARGIPLNPNRFAVATRLGQTVIGDKTATEIGWVEP